MCISSIINRYFRTLITLSVALATSGVSAQETIVLSKVFQICVRHLPGLTADPKQGIDAVEGQIAHKGAAIYFMIGGNPSLPAGMNIMNGKNGYILPPLSNELQLIAESAGPLQVGMAGRPIGNGTERLYAFNKGMVTTPVGPIQDQIFVQLWSDGHQRNDRLVKTVGDALIRCR